MAYSNATFSDFHISTIQLPDFNQWQFSSQKRKSRRNKFATNTLPNRLKRQNNSIRQNADIIRYTSSMNLSETNDLHAKLQNSLKTQTTFLPHVHSTPIYKNKHNEQNVFKTTGKTTNLNINRQTSSNKLDSTYYMNDYELFKNRKAINVPTISKKVDSENHQINRISTTFCDSGKVIKRRGIRGVSWILRLALEDNSIGKIYRAQIGWILLIFIAFLIIGALLAYFSKYFLMYHLVSFTNQTELYPFYGSKRNISFDMHTVKERTTNITEDSKNYFSTNKTNNVPVMENQTDFYDDNYKTENLNISININDSNNSSIENIDDQLLNLCKRCRKKLDVCILEGESGIPTCRSALDVNDPTGCGGLCALEIEACHLLHQKYKIYTCRPLEILPVCKNDEWRCKNHFCIPELKRCDGMTNCYDRSDETDCNECDLTLNFHCGNNTSCLSISKKCNGIVDCWDAFDEYNCTSACPDNKFSCTNGECINLSMFCDGFPDCKDESDEPIGCRGNCRQHEFKCTNKRCINKWQVCDNSDDCGDNSDESRCPHFRTVTKSVGMNNKKIASLQFTNP